MVELQGHLLLAAFEIWRLRPLSVWKKEIPKAHPLLISPIPADDACFARVSDGVNMGLQAVAKGRPLTGLEGRECVERSLAARADQHLQMFPSQMLQNILQAAQRVPVAVWMPIWVPLVVGTG